MIGPFEREALVVLVGGAVTIILGCWDFGPLSQKQLKGVRGAQREARGGRRL